MKTRIPTEAEYTAHEARLFRAEIARVEQQSMDDRKAGRADWADLLTAPDVLSERTAWLLAGNYGKGAFEAAWTIARNAKMNRSAAIGQILAALDCRCTAKNARAAWLGLTEDQQDAANNAILAAIEAAIEEEKEG